MNEAKRKKVKTIAEKVRKLSDQFEALADKIDTMGIEEQMHLDILSKRKKENEDDVFAVEKDLDMFLHIRAELITTTNSLHDMEVYLEALSEPDIKKRYEILQHK